MECEPVMDCFLVMAFKKRDVPYASSRPPSCHTEHGLGTGEPSMVIWIKASRTLGMAEQRSEKNLGPDPLWSQMLLQTLTLLLEREK